MNFGHSHFQLLDFHICPVDDVLNTERINQFIESVKESLLCQNIAQANLQFVCQPSPGFLQHPI